MNTATHRLRLLDALRLLPGVRPALERDRLGQAKYWATRSSEGLVEYNGAAVRRVDLEQLFLKDEQDRPCISPAGAAFLLDLYNRNVFDLAESRKTSGNLDLLSRYAAGEHTSTEPLVGPGHPCTPRKRKPRLERAMVPAPTDPAMPVDYVRSYGLTIHKLD